jgi:hypothetical protein
MRRRVTRVGSPVIGRIIDLENCEGQEVQKGQLLRPVNSTGLSRRSYFPEGVITKQVAQRAVECASAAQPMSLIG